MALRVVPPVAVCVEDILATLARTLHGVSLPPRMQATHAEASPEEGLALLANYRAIEDPNLRQAVLDLAALLAMAPGE